MARGADVYRAAELDVPGPPPTELVYEAVDRDRNRGAVVAMFQIFTLPMIAASATAVFVSPSAAIGALAGGVGLSLWHRRRSALREGAILRFESGSLVVLSRQGGAELARIPVREIDDVVLEARAIQRVQDGPSAVPAVRFTETTLGPELHHVRIAIERHGGARVRLTESYLANSETTEWFGKVRVFLRKHGWVPVSERD